MIDCLAGVAVALPREHTECVQRDRSDGERGEGGWPPDPKGRADTLDLT